jgi:TonB family protein
MVPAITPGFLVSVFEAVKCRTGGSDAFGAARLMYHADGRPKQVGTDPSQLSETCAQMLDIVASLSIAAADDPVLPDGVQWLFVPTNKDVVGCIDAPRKATPHVSISSDKIKPPRKTKHVNPQYPEAMRRAGIQGQVILVATIAPDGCVTGAKVLRGVRPALDVAAMIAVSGWRFTPTLLDGNPVPVTMTVTVNFALQ